MIGRLALAVVVAVAGCRGDAAPAAGGGSGSAAVVELRARPAAVVEVTLKALGIT